MQDSAFRRSHQGTGNELGKDLLRDIVRKMIGDMSDREG
jgi:hypothetical protein